MKTDNNQLKGDAIVNYGKMREKPMWLDLNWRHQNALVYNTEMCRINGLRSRDTPGAVGMPNTQILVSKYHFLLKGLRAESRVGAWKAPEETGTSSSASFTLRKYPKQVVICQRNTGAPLMGLPLAKLGMTGAAKDIMIIIIVIL